jgi:hypothetical protein
MGNINSKCKWTNPADVQTATTTCKGNEITHMLQLYGKSSVNVDCIMHMGSYFPGYRIREYLTSIIDDDEEIKVDVKRQYLHDFTLMLLVGGFNKANISEYWSTGIPNYKLTWRRRGYLRIPFELKWTLAAISIAQDIWDLLCTHH